MLTWEDGLYTKKILPIELYTGISDNQVSFFMMNDKCYIMDGVNYLVFDGTTVSTATPYIPEISISKLPAGGGTTNEDFNLLGAGFIDSFSGDATSKDYQLSLTNLDDTAITASIDGGVTYDKVETTHFTVNRTTGKVTWITAPPTGTNNVKIKAFKTQSTFPNRVKKCRFHTTFGGSNDTRVFVSGNPDMPDYVWRSELYDPTYFPENGFYKFPDKVMGFSKQYDYLVIERANGKHQVTFDLSSGFSSFPNKPINDQVGTLAGNSIQIIENNPVSLSKDGVYMLTASNVKDERNVSRISEPIDAKLLSEPNLDKAVSVDYDKKYWLAINGNVYVYDYSIREWYLYDNIYASCFLEMDGYLYFGSSTDGLIYKINKENDDVPYNDDGQVINAYWKSKHFTFNADESKKMVEKVFYSLKPAGRTSVDLYYVTNKKHSDLVKSTRMNLLDFRSIDFNDFSFLTNDFPQESMAKIKAKKITHFQLILKNDKVDESLGILSVGIKYRYQAYIK